MSLFMSTSNYSFNRYASYYCSYFRSTFIPFFVGDFFVLLRPSISLFSSSISFISASLFRLSFISSATNSYISTSSASFNFTGVATTLLTFLFSWFIFLISSRSSFNSPLLIYASNFTLYYYISFQASFFYWNCYSSLLAFLRCMSKIYSTYSSRSSSLSIFAFIILFICYWFEVMAVAPLIMVLNEVWLAPKTEWSPAYSD